MLEKNGIGVFINFFVDVFGGVVVNFVGLVIFGGVYVYID